MSVWNRVIVVGLGSAFLAIQCHAAPVATYSFGMTDFVESPSGSAIYATVPSQNSIAVINPNTFQATLVGIGSNPTGLALSSDGTKLYVANQGSNFLGVLNTATNTPLTPIPLGVGVNPLDVKVGTNNRLWVLTGAQNQFDSIIQVNATTGTSTGPGPSGFIYGGRIHTTSDGATLYYGSFGTSPSYEYQYDVSGTSPSTLYSTSLGSNGTDVSVSRDGSLFAFPQGGNSQNQIIQSSSHLALGSVGPATSLAFSPDNAFAYTGISYALGLPVYNLTTFLQTGTIPTVGPPQELFVDNSGANVFSDEVGTTSVYATGRSVPEPGALMIASVGVVAWSLRRRRTT